MQENPVCPRCGQGLVDGRCLSCGILSTLPTAPSAKPTERNETRLVTFFVVGYLALTGLLVLLGYFGIRRIYRHRAESYASLRHHTGPVARLDELKGNGRIYLVQMGTHNDPYSLNDFAHWLNTRYALDVRVLPPTPLDPSAWNASRKQYAAESICEQLKHDHPDLAADPDAYLIGFIDFDMYTTNAYWRSTFTARDNRRAAIISSEGMQDTPLQIRVEDSGGNPAGATSLANQHFQARLHRILIKDVAILYWHLPVNRDTTSLLHDTLDPDLPTEDIYESDVYPARAPHGEAMREPCVFFEYTAARGIKLRAGQFIRSCSDSYDPEEDNSLETFELDLRRGLLIDKRTDFFLPDSIPIKFERVTRDGWKGVNPFGISGSDSYDEYLASRDNITISMVRADGGSRNLVRQPPGVSNLSLVKYVDVADPGLFEMRWRPNPYEHYDVNRFDGAVLTFLPCNSPNVWCYLTDFHDFAGRELKFVRGDHRRLERLVSPGQSWISIEYDPLGRIEQVTDSRGRVVHYGYDPANRLTSVTYPSGERCLYTYDSSQHLLTFSASADAHTPPRLLMRNDFSNGLLVKQTFEDGSTYSYDYSPEVADKIQSVTARSADGRRFNLKINHSFAIVREQ